MPRRGEGRTITAEGRTLTVLQWATWRGWDEHTIRNRLRNGWDPVRAVTEEPRPDMRGKGRDPADAVRERRRRRAELGLCIHCGTPAEPGKTQCSRHLKAAASSMRDLQRTRRELGMCVRCDDPAQPGFATCEAHAETGRAAQEDRRAHKVSIGECVSCKRRAAKGHVMCRKHLAAKSKDSQASDKARRAAVKDEHRAEGTCTECGGKRVKGRTLCIVHWRKLKALDAARKERLEKAKTIVRPGVIRRKKTTPPSGEGT